MRVIVIAILAGVNVTYPSRPGIPPLSTTQLLVNPEMGEFQLVDLSRRFLTLDSFWTLPRQFLGNKVRPRSLQQTSVPLQNNICISKGAFMPSGDNSC